MKRELSPERVRELLSYNPESGEMHWRKNMKGGARAGDLAGFSDGNGYRQSSVDGKKVRIHRLAWAHYYGCWPAQDIDHIDGDRSNNRIANLRDVTRALNIQNQRKSKRGALGVLGVTPRDGKFVAQINIGGVHHYLGRHNTTEQAHEAYVNAKRKLHAGCTL